jgi:hypothetical protein
LKKSNAIALFDIQRSRSLDNFFTGGGRSLFFASKGRSSLMTFSRAAGDRSFWYRKVEIPLLLFYGRRAIAFLGWEAIAFWDERAIAFWG